MKWVIIIIRGKEQSDQLNMHFELDARGLIKLLSG